MTFAAPYWFFLLLLLPVLMIYQRRQRRKDAVVYPSLALFDGGGRTWRQRLLFIPPLCLHLALACLIACLARPQVESTGQREDREGIAFFLLAAVRSSCIVCYSGSNQTRGNVVLK